jgi:hypothetical protein
MHFGSRPKPVPLVAGALLIGVLAFANHRISIVPQKTLIPDPQIPRPSRADLPSQATSCVRDVCEPAGSDAPAILVWEYRPAGSPSIQGPGGAIVRRTQAREAQPDYLKPDSPSTSRHDLPPPAAI